MILLYYTVRTESRGIREKPRVGVMIPPPAVVCEVVGCVVQPVYHWIW
jgi:hypothetical protein